MFSFSIIRRVCSALGILLSLLTLTPSAQAQSGWQDLTLPHTPGYFNAPQEVAFDGAGNLYLYDATPFSHDLRLQMRDSQGNWKSLAAYGVAVGQVAYVSDMAVDASGNLYIAEYDPYNTFWGPRIQKRSPDGNWSLVATQGREVGKVYAPVSIAVDQAGNLYVAENNENAFFDSRIQRRDPQGNWSVIAGREEDARSTRPGRVQRPVQLLTDEGDNLLVVEQYRIQKRNPQGNWSFLHHFLPEVAHVGYYGAALGSGNVLYLISLDQYDPSLPSYHFSYFIEKVDLDDLPPATNTPSPFPSFERWVEVSPTNPFLNVFADTQGRVYLARHSFVGRPAHTGLPAEAHISLRTPEGQESIFAASPPPPLGKILGAMDIALNSADRLYVADTFHNRIQMRDSQSNWSIAVPPGTELGTTERPTRVCADEDGNLYVESDRKRREWEKRDPQGTWARLPLGAPSPCGDQRSLGSGLRDRSGRVYTYDPSRGLLRSDTQDSFPTLFMGIGDALGQVRHAPTLLFDSQDRVYVIDNRPYDPNHPSASAEVRIQRWNLDGTWTLLTEEGSMPRMISNVEIVKLDKQDNLYVVDVLPGTDTTYRLQRMGKDGRWTVLLPPQKEYIKDLEIDSKGGIYALVPVNNRIFYLPASSIPQRMGDVNLSGEVSIPDVILTLRAAVGMETPTLLQVAAGDLDGDGALTVGDAFRILRIIVHQ